MMNWLPEAEQALRNNQYPRIVAIYETAIAAHPEEFDYYFYLGLALSLIHI